MYWHVASTIEYTNDSYLGILVSHRHTHTLDPGSAKPHYRRLLWHCSYESLGIPGLVHTGGYYEPLHSKESELSSVLPVNNILLR